MFTIYAVSDSIGETAEQVAKASASQFKEEIEIKRVSYIKTIDDVNEFVKRFDKDKNCMVISTIVTMDIREFLVERCIEKGVRIINTLGPCISMLSAALGSMPEYKPGAVWNIDADYYKKIEAMEFAIQYDDSKNNKGILNADLVILGLSRTSKTVLCMYLANKGIKAINVPLMPEVPIPEELFKIDPKKIIGLTIDPMELIDIRKNRLQKFQMLSSDIQYANAERILDELEFADRVMRRLRCKVIDITKRAIEDTATIILKYIEKK